MIYGIIAIVSLIHHYGNKARRYEVPCFDVVGDFTIRQEEAYARRNELDLIEIQMQEIENELRIKDDIAHLRKAAYKYEIQRLEDAKDRHSTRLEEIEY